MEMKITIMSWNVIDTNIVVELTHISKCVDLYSNDFIYVLKIL